MNWYQKQLINTGLIINITIAATGAYAEQPKQINFVVKQFIVEGESPLTDTKINDLLDPYQNQQYDLSQLQAVAKSLEQEIRDQGYAFYRVVLPPQTLGQGSVTLRIISFSINEITVEGHQYFDSENIKASLPTLKTDKSPNTETLAEYLKVANRHPSKNLKLTFKQSEIEDSIDAKINVADQRPYQASLIMNNTGTNRTGEFRMTAAVQYSNLWNKDHILNGSYTTSPDHMETVQQYSVNYSAPIYALKGWLSTYYAFSDVDTGVIANDFLVTGSGEMYGLHYLQYLPKLGAYEHALDIGIDNRFFINDIQFEGSQIGNNIRSVPFSILYKGEFSWAMTEMNYHLQWVGNTGLGGHNSQQHYNNSRFNAPQDWDLIRYGANLSRHWGEWLFNANLTGQYSDSPLISGEQFGLGGSYNVRGYNERETSADSGEQFSLELYTPFWKGVNLLTFYDYGHGRQQNILEGEKKSWTLNSVGVGARWQWKDYLYASIDLAHALNEGIAIDGTQAGTNRIHASLVLRY